MPLDDEIDALYQLTPDTFTAARNELAKRAGDRGAEVRKLAKPSAAAWAVNQLYWRRRPVFDALAKASEARRSAHVRQLGGKEADLSLADARHRAALDAAFDAATAFLKQSGDALSHATLNALTQTLEAVPSPEIRGRLARPIEPVGFSMLASLMTGKNAGSIARPPADVVVMKRRDGKTGKDEKKAAEEARRVVEERKRERERLKKELATVQAKEREETNALAKARQEADRIGARVEKLEKELDEARMDLADRREAASRARSALNEAVTARVALERKLQEIEE